MKHKRLTALVLAAATLPAAVLSLPMDSELTDAEVERVADAVCRYFADNESRYHE